MKRKIAAALAIIMVGAQYAAPFVHAEGTTEVEVGGSAAVATLDDSVVKVVVPTTKALNFTLDPEGLLAVADQANGVNGSDEDTFKPYSGRILGNTALVFANKSIRPVTVTTKFQVDGVDDNQVVATQAAVKKENSTTANLLFMAVPNSEAIKLTYAGATEGVSTSESLADIDNHQTGNSFSTVAAGAGYVFTKTATTVKSVVPEAAHTVSFDSDEGTFDYTLDTDKKNSAAGFIISGFCNPYGDYSKVGSVKVKASYSFQKATAAEVTSAKNPIDSTFAVISAVKDGETTNLTPVTVSDKGITTKSKVKVVASTSAKTATTTFYSQYNLVIVEIPNISSVVASKMTDVKVGNGSISASSIEANSNATAFKVTVPSGTSVGDTVTFKYDGTSYQGKLVAAS